MFFVPVLFQSSCVLFSFEAAPALRALPPVVFEVEVQLDLLASIDASVGGCGCLPAGAGAGAGAGATAVMVDGQIRQITKLSD